MEHTSPEALLVSLAAVLVLGIGSQWLAWRLRLPSILLLLVVGFVAGPVTGFLDPDALLGPILFPTISVAVGLILFEGGLGLRLSELRSIGNVVGMLVTVGAAVSWGLGTLFAHALLGLPFPTALLLGAILVVTGPTVILPLLRFVRPKGDVSRILRWEGIVIDPIGATLAVLVFEAILSGSLRGSTPAALQGAGLTLLAGGGLGLVGALLLIFLLKRHLIPDYLQETVTLMLVVAVFVGANLLQGESGLLATTVMGIVLANQRKVTTYHILRFKENLGVLLISSIFILLAARIEVGQLAMLGWRALAFVILLIVASVFAHELIEKKIAGAEMLVPVVFSVIVVTVAFYGLSSTPLARILGLSQRDPQGVLLVGAHGWARRIAAELQEAGVVVRLVDTNRNNIRQARMEGLPTWHGSILSHSAVDELEVSDLGRLLALTPNDEANSLAALNFSELFGRSEVYQLPPAGLQREKDGDEGFSPQYLRGRFLFAPHANYLWLSRKFGEGADLKTTTLSEEFGWEDFQALHGTQALPLFWIDENRRVEVVSAQDAPRPRPGRTVVALIDGNL